MKGYGITPLGPGWGWGSRLIEVALQTVFLVLAIVTWPLRTLVDRVGEWWWNQ